MNNTLTIKNFIVIGNKNFHNKIKTIESQFIYKKIGYLSMNQVRDYLNQNNKEKYRNFTYMIIINAEDVDNYIKELYYIKNEYALIIFLIIYIEDKNILINKKILMNYLNIPVFFANHINEIKDFIISQENFDSVDYSLILLQKI